MKFFPKRAAVRRISAALVFCALAAAPVPVFCADFEVRAEADKTEAASGEIVNFSVTISGQWKEVPRVQLMEWEGFNLAATRQAQQIRINRGKKIESIVLMYALVAGDPGDRVLGPVKVQYKGEIYETKPVQVKIIAGPNRPRLQGGVVL